MQHPTLKLIKKFDKKHGKSVLVPGEDELLLFEDGAQRENEPDGMGVLLPPPDDEWERAKLIARYYEICATQAEEAFDDLRDYMLGDGVCPEGLDTEEDQLAHLKKLKVQATAAKRKYREARKAIKDAKPFWLKQKEASKATERRDRSAFREKVRSIKL